MTDAAHIVTGMWGTTNLVLSVVNIDTGLVVAEKTGPGVSMLDGRTAEDAFFDMIGPWQEQFDVKAAQLGGMVGSNIGWIDVPYLQCPIAADQINDNTFNFQARGLPISIIPGLSCHNPFGHFDVMRGEETEILSWFDTATDAQKKDTIMCIPGTHNKWVQIKDGKIESFFTSVVGEVYQVISANGVLAKPHYQKNVQSSFAFMQAVMALKEHPKNLLNLLFTTRANTIAGKFTDTDATDYLSGLLIAADLNAAIDCFGEARLKEAAIPVIGATHLLDRYTQALSAWGITTDPIRASDVGVRGLVSTFKKGR